MASRALQMDHDDTMTGRRNEEGGGGGEKEEEVYGGTQKRVENLHVELGMNGNGNGNVECVLRMGSMEKGEGTSNAHDDEDTHRRIQEELAVVLASRDANTVATMV